MLEEVLKQPQAEALWVTAGPLRQASATVLSGV